jgi:hypothetical protein
MHKLEAFTDHNRAAQQRVRTLIWNFYAALKAYRANPDKSRCPALRARFDRIFRRRTGFVTLDRLLARLHANKDELLMVLDQPETPLHTNGSENDIRCQVTRRKLSAGTRSDPGRDCRDAFLGLAKTRAKLGVAFWDYLESSHQVDVIEFLWASMALFDDEVQDPDTAVLYRPPWQDLHSVVEARQRLFAATGGSARRHIARSAPAARPDQRRDPCPPCSAPPFRLVEHLACQS